MSRYFSSVLLLVYFCGVCFGAFLASDWTAEVSSAVTRVLRNHSIWRVYSGVHKIQIISTEGGIYTEEDVCDVMMKPIKWAKTELCGVFNSNSSTDFIDCKLQLPSICYISESEAEPTCGKNCFGYEYSPETKHCYKFHIDVQTWMDANKTCIEEGALLTVPNSETEVGVITAMHNRYSDSEIHNTKWPSEIHIGTYWKSGVWKTLDGSTLAHSGYEKWRSGFPSHKDSLEQCPYLTMNRKGYYSNLCTEYHEKYPFVCEKNSQS